MRDAGLHYCLFDPTGNITALVESAVEVPDQPAVANGIMCRHPEVEQVGFLSLPAFPALPYLRMAGGEFCGNASMCAAALTALRRGMKPETGSSLLLRVSGAQRPVAVCLQEEGEGCWSASVTMAPARSVEEQAFRFGDLQGMLPLVRMEGISHLLVEPDSPFSRLLADRTAAEQAVRRWCGELQTDGLGLMFVFPSEERPAAERALSLAPLVYIPVSDTLFWENSCASGSAAAHALRRKRPRRRNPPARPYKTDRRIYPIKNTRRVFFTAWRDSCMQDLHEAEKTESGVCGGDTG